MTDLIPTTLFIRGEESSDEDAWDDTILVQQYDESVNQLKQEVAKLMGINGSEEESRLSKEKTNSNSKNRSKRHEKKPNNEWQVGSFCQAKYSEDNKFYEATIISIHENKGTCTVKYFGYDNQEEVFIDTLLPSSGRSARKAQEEEAMNEQLLEIEKVEGAGELDHSDSCSPREEWSKSQMKSQTSHVGRRHRRRKRDSPDITPSLKHNIQLQENRHFPGWPSQIPPPPPPPPHLFEHFSSDDSEALSAMLMSWYMSGYHTGYYYGLRQAKTQLDMEDGGRHYPKGKKN